MNSEKQAFLDALKENEDDLATRLVFADWLEENDEPEEADRHRKWNQAKEWLMEFVKDINYEDFDYDDVIGQEITHGTFSRPHKYEDVIEAGYGAVSGDGYCFGSDAGQDYFYDKSASEEFFRNWSIVTGVVVSEEVVESPGFSCAC